MKSSWSLFKFLDQKTAQNDQKISKIKLSLFRHFACLVSQITREIFQLFQFWPLENSLDFHQKLQKAVSKNQVWQENIFASCKHLEHHKQKMHNKNSPGEETFFILPLLNFLGVDGLFMLEKHTTEIPTLFHIFEPILLLFWPICDTFGSFLWYFKAVLSTLVRIHFWVILHYFWTCLSPFSWISNLVILPHVCAIFISI